MVSQCGLSMVLLVARFPYHTQGQSFGTADPAASSPTLHLFVCSCAHALLSRPTLPNHDQRVCENRVSRQSAFAAYVYVQAGTVQLAPTSSPRVLQLCSRADQALEVAVLVV